jgi:hypothetical protein
MQRRGLIGRRYCSEYIDTGDGSALRSAGQRRDTENCNAKRQGEAGIRSSHILLASGANNVYIVHEASIQTGRLKGVLDR